MHDEEPCQLWQARAHVGTGGDMEVFFASEQKARYNRILEEVPGKSLDISPEKQNSVRDCDFVISLRYQETCSDDNILIQYYIRI